MQRFTNHFSTRKTPQSEPIPGKQMVQNSAGGYAFAVDDWKRLERFLILGTEGGTYYTTEQKLTQENAQAVLRCIQADGKRTVDAIVDVSKRGRAPKNDPALFALAMAASMGDTETRKRALDALPAVARIGTHLFHFVEYCKGFRGWGRGMRDAVASWYNDKPADKLAYQMVKYQQRDGWSHRDLLRLAHPKPVDRYHDYCYHYATTGHLGEITTEGNLRGGDSRPLLMAATDAKEARSAEEIVSLIQKVNLPRECIPTQFLKEPKVWEALLENMPMTAMIRNLGKMSSIGLLSPLSAANKTVCERLGDSDLLQKARVHPIQILAALTTYDQGHGFRGSLSWHPVPQVLEALDGAFYKSFDFVKPTGKNYLIGVDVSSSMTWGDISGVPSLTPCKAAAAMSLVIAHTEPNYYIHGFAGEFRDLGIRKGMGLTEATRRAQDNSFGTTDCAVPMLYATHEGIDVDVCIVVTDNETWVGDIHPVQALQKYREKSGRAAKLVVMAMTSSGFSIADQNDAGMLDVVGFDTAVPNVIADFARE